MRTDKIGKDTVVRFEGFSDLGDNALRLRDPKGSSEDRDKTWNGGTASVSEARDLLVKGWDKPTEQVAKITERVREQVGEVVSPIIQFYNGTVGTRLDVGLWSAGDPNCFYTFFEEEGRRSERFVRILVDNAFSASVNADDIITRGAAVIALCDALNLQGYSTEVWCAVAVGDGMNRDADKFYTVVPVQSAGQPWDVRSAIFPLSHPSFLRRLHFGVVEGSGAEAVKKFGSGNSYGFPIGVTAGDTLDTLVGGADIILSSKAGNIKDITADPSKWVLEQLRKCGAYVG
jgi:hypothetical protein